MPNDDIEYVIPAKAVYEIIYWKSFDEMKDCTFNKYGLEVKQKIAERAVCLMDIPDDWGKEYEIEYTKTFDAAISFAKE